MDLQLASTARPLLAAAMAVPRAPLHLSGVTLRHLRGPAAIATVLHLREEIDLSVHAAAGPQFEVLEKKETSAGTSLVSSWTAN